MLDFLGSANAGRRAYIEQGVSPERAKAQADLEAAFFAVAPKPLRAPRQIGNTPVPFRSLADEGLDQLEQAGYEEVYDATKGWQGRP